MPRRTQKTTRLCKCLLKRIIKQNPARLIFFHLSYFSIFPFLSYLRLLLLLVDDPKKWAAEIDARPQRYGNMTRNLGVERGRRIGRRIALRLRKVQRLELNTTLLDGTIRIRVIKSGSSDPYEYYRHNASQWE